MMAANSFNSYQNVKGNITILLAFFKNNRENTLLHINSLNLNHM